MTEVVTKPAPKGNARGSGYARHPFDYYIEPEWIVRALLKVERFEGWIWDPACGSGTIPRVCRASGYFTCSSDIFDRGASDWTADFFDHDASISQVKNIVSNPPYTNLQRFVEKALDLASGKVAIFARLAFLEGQRRKAFFQARLPARVYVSAKRVSCPPGDQDVPSKDGSAAYAWFVWDRALTVTDTVLRWI